MITVEQIRAARAMLGLKQSELAKKSGLSLSTLNKIERGIQTDPQTSTIRAIRLALEAEGIKFTAQGCGEMSVSLKLSRTSRPNRKILIIDDSVPDRTLYREWLLKHPNDTFDVSEADNAKDGYEAFLQYRPACIILDFVMYGMTGFQLLVTMKQNAPIVPPIIFVTGMHSAPVEEGVRAQGVNIYLKKRSLSRDKFYAALEKAFAA